MDSEKKKPVAAKPKKVQPELTRAQRRLLERYERRQELRRKWGLI